MLAAGGAVAAAALAVGVTAALRPAPAPLSVVTGALARTSAQSYTFSVGTTVRSGTETLNSVHASGAYEPGRGLGTEQLTAGSGGQAKRARIRFVGASIYTSVTPAAGFGQIWDRSPLRAAMSAPLTPGEPYSFVSDRPVVPSGLDVVLRSAGTAVHDSGPASGPGWTGTSYTFAASLDNGQESFSGDVAVDKAGQVRRMTITEERRGQAGRKPFATVVRDVTFGPLGAPVTATPPPASQVKATSGTPYWGFYF